MLTPQRPRGSISSRPRPAPRQPGASTTTGRSRPALQQVYQEFQPTYEWRQEEGCAVLVVDLPGFTKEQVGVQVQDSDKLRVSGARLLRPNTWSRFNQAFPIPEDCTTSGIQAKFENGILYVTFQRKKREIRQVDTEEEQAKPTQQPPLSPPKPIAEVKDFTPEKPSPSIIGPDQQRDEKNSQFANPQDVSPPTASTSGGDGKRVEAPSKPKSEMDEKRDLKQTISTTQGKSQTEAKSIEEQRYKEVVEKEEGLAAKLTAGEERGKTSHDDMEKTTAEEKSEGALGKAFDLKQTESSEKIGQGSKLTAESSAENALGKALDQKQTEGSEKIGKESKLTGESSAENALVKALDQKQTEGSEKIGKESKLTAENVIQKRVEKEKIDGPATGLDQKAAIGKYSNATKIGRPTKNAVDGYTYGKYKQIVKDFITPKTEEDRKLLVNIGVAALVIVALGAYITYSHWSSEEPKNQ